MSRRTALRAKNIMYTQQLEHMSCSVDECRDIVCELNPSRWALIIHNNDVDESGEKEADHLHLMMSFENARYISSLAKQLNDKPQYFEIINGQANNGYSYLTHRTENAKEKYQYDPAEVTANFDYIGLLASISSKLSKAKSKIRMQDFLDAMFSGDITKKELESSVNGSLYGKYKSQIENVWAKRLAINAEKWRKQAKESGVVIKVIWLFGEAGTGKTSFAREISKRRNEPYFLTGSSRDLFQNYAGEHCVIIDEARPRQIPYSDLLKITDPYSIENETMLGARYNDKVLSADLIIVTSPFDPYGYYARLKFSQEDSFEQLQRRITVCIYMTQNAMYKTEYNSLFKHYEPIEESKKHNKYSSLNRDKNKDSTDIYESLFDDKKNENVNDLEERIEGKG